MHKKSLILAFIAKQDPSCAMPLIRLVVVLFSTLIGIPVLQLFANVSKTETNANQLVEICIVTPETARTDESNFFDFRKELVLRVAFYTRSYTPRNEKEVWKPDTLDPSSVSIRLMDQWPRSTRILDVTKTLPIDSNLLSVAFERDPTFFRDLAEVLLSLDSRYYYIFHFRKDVIFGSASDIGIRPCRREENANNRVDVQLLNSNNASPREKELLGLDENIGFRISSYERSYEPRDDKERWKALVGEPYAALEVPNGTEPYAKITHRPVRTVKISHSEYYFAFRINSNLEATDEFSLSLTIPFGFLRSYSYVLAYRTSEVLGSTALRKPNEPIPSPLTIGADANSEERIYIVGDGVEPPVPVAQPLPADIDDPFAGYVRGTIILETVIGKDGNVKKCRITQGLSPRLDNTLLETVVQEWRFKPGTLKGTAVDVAITVNVNWNLREGSAPRKTNPRP